jgi:hypothetical protein
MVGGVLVERTVKDVLPALQTNFDGVSKEKKRNRRSRSCTNQFWNGTTEIIDPTSYLITVAELQEEGGGFHCFPEEAQYSSGFETVMDRIFGYDDITYSKSANVEQLFSQNSIICSFKSTRRKYTHR